MTDFTVVNPRTQTETIAVNRQIRDFRHLVGQYGAGRWHKRKGLAHIAYPDGTAEFAEIHWYEANGIGKREFKHKHTLVLLP